MAELGGVAKIQVSEGSDPDLKVFKCPKLTCSFYSPNSYEDVTLHRIKEHGEVPSFITGRESGHQAFSRERLAKNNVFVMKYKINKAIAEIEAFAQRMFQKKAPRKAQIPIKVS